MKKHSIDPLLIAAIAVALTACASSAPVPTIASALPEPSEHPTVELVGSLETDHEELSLLIEAALEHIGRKEAVLADSFQADIEAVSSVEIPDEPSVGRALDLFSNELRPKIQESLDRSTIYKPMIDAVLDEYGLPRALTYLPVIESGYISSSSSRVGALGIWQFMPGTAREYGLRVDWWVDERVDPLESTRAAAAYLRDLFDMFGDWPLAIASYNAGPGRVRRAMRSIRADSFWDIKKRRRLPRETRGYVPTFYATLRIVSDPRAHGFRLCDPIDDPFGPIDELTIEGPVTLDFIAETGHVDAGTLYALNPSYRQGILPPGRSKVRIPRDAAVLVRDLAEHLSESDHFLPVTRYEVRRGDSLRAVGRRLGVSHFAISAMNANIRSLRAGEQIYVPLRRDDLPARLLKASYETVHVVRRGDTLSGIAKKYGLTARELAAMNNISVRSLIHPGDRLMITSGIVFTAGM